jgi:uncharacterized protein YdeI (YjbR/CyaY-like superfamily)
MGRPGARSFASRDALAAWLEENHTASSELWVRIFKKSAKRPSVAWEDCVVVAITWGWIDGQRRSLDEESFLQRLTPRRSGSNWSKRNREHAERLIAGEIMEPPGLAQVAAARADGRWERAYAGSADMVFPEDFLLALRDAPKAQAFFATLSRTELFSIYYGVQTAKRVDTRKRRIVSAVKALAAGKSPSAR